MYTRMMIVCVFVCACMLAGWVVWSECVSIFCLKFCRNQCDYSLMRTYGTYKDMHVRMCGYWFECAHASMRVYAFNVRRLIIHVCMHDCCIYTRLYAYETCRIGTSISSGTSAWAALSRSIIDKSEEGKRVFTLCLARNTSNNAVNSKCAEHTRTHTHTHR